ncbi:hypothetical protein GCM10028796_37690 [Ramlibacter monticola]
MIRDYDNIEPNPQQEEFRNPASFLCEFGPHPNAEKGIRKKQRGNYERCNDGSKKRRSGGRKASAVS